MCLFLVGIDDFSYQAGQSLLLHRKAHKLRVEDTETVNITHRLFLVVQKKGNIFTQCGRNFQNHIQRRILHAALQAADVGSLGSHTPCKLRLRNVLFQPGLYKLGNDFLPLS